MVNMMIEFVDLCFVMKPVSSFMGLDMSKDAKYVQTLWKDHVLKQSKAKGMVPLAKAAWDGDIGRCRAASPA